MSNRDISAAERSWRPPHAYHRAYPCHLPIIFIVLARSETLLSAAARAVQVPLVVTGGMVCPVRGGGCGTVQRKRVGSRQNACSGALGQGRSRECRSRLRALKRGYWQLQAACKRYCLSKCNRGFCRSRGPLAVALRAHACACRMSAAFGSYHNARMPWRCSARRVLCAQLRPNCEAATAMLAE